MIVIDMHLCLEEDILITKCKRVYWDGLTLRMRDKQMVHSGANDKFTHISIKYYLKL